MANLKPRSPGLAVEVKTEIEIERPRSQVAAYAADPDNATSWYENIKAVDWETPHPLVVGSRIAFVAVFLGRTLAYTYEIEDLATAERARDAHGAGPLPRGNHIHLGGRGRRRYPHDASQSLRAARLRASRRAAHHAR